MKQYNAKNILNLAFAGHAGCGKTSVLYSVLKNVTDKNICMGKCTPLTQLTPGGVIQDMLINREKDQQQREKYIVDIQ